MARKTTQYVCQECGGAHLKWSGRCDACGAWNTLIEEAAPEQTPKGLGSRRGRKIAFVGLDGEPGAAPRRASGIKEFDRACGGGLVPGSALLVGGDPGIGKSTLLLQVSAALAANLSCAYISGEESIDQLRLRAKRLGLDKAPVQLAAATSVRDIAAALDDRQGPDVVVIDSIQTMFVDSLESAPGTVAQVRTSAQELIKIAKKRGFCVLLVGHVTKDGQIAGPKVLEHMVDTVLYFEGDRSHQFRILRSVKNRFGATDEIGVFEMTGAGLAEIANPSSLFLADREANVSGACVFAGIEGTRPLLVEIQALTASTTFAAPRRAVVGWDSGRLAMILAVLESRSGLVLGNSDVYLNVAGGLRITEPAADLTVAAALASSASGVPVAAGTVVFGEVGLSGEVRVVAQMDARLKEAGKLGFTNAIIPKMPGKRRRDKLTGGLEIREILHLSDLLALLRPTAGGGRRSGKQGQRSMDHPSREGASHG